MNTITQHDWNILDKEVKHAEKSGVPLTVQRYHEIIHKLLEVVHVYGFASYDINFGDDKTCVCGHPYYRHFDSYTENMDPIGCKYCHCHEFVLRDEGKPVCECDHLEEHHCANAEGKIYCKYCYCECYEQRNDNV